MKQQNDMANIQTPGLNPFLPFDLYIPDGEPKVFGNRVYLYGSLDKENGSYCSREYHVVSAPVDDLTDWTDHGVSFSSDLVPWSNAALYAPDVLFHGGRYYLFFCMADGSEGVAQSDFPQGPFVQPRRITLAGEPITGIDPSVLEDDGHIYYTWGQFSLQMGELADDLCSLKPETVRSDALSNADGREGFHEGSSLRKLGKRYCMIYASEYAAAFPHHGARPTKLDYALSESPFGPYVRRGTVIDNEGCDPSTWNNHGSVLKIGNDWYVFYHASSANGAYLRRARAEKLQVDEENGVIAQAKPTTNGFVPILLPEMITSPLHACRFFGLAYTQEISNGVFAALLPGAGAGFSFSSIRFESGNYSLTVHYRASKDVRVRVQLGTQSTEPQLLPENETGGCVTIPLTAAAGVFPLSFERTDAAEDAACAILRLNLRESTH